MFKANSRVERRSGIRFYEQDLLYSEYAFEGDLTIDFTVSYRAPGIGILLSEVNEKPFGRTDHLYLFKLGQNVFKVMERHFLSVATPVEASCAFAPELSGPDANLLFNKRGRSITMQLVTQNPVSGARQLRELGHYTLPDALSAYRVGFYSNAGNTLKAASFLCGTPSNWLTNIKNTNGGRIAFFKNGFRVEGCEYDAELEQQEIELKAGVYFVDFKTAPIDGRFDLVCSVFLSGALAVDDRQKNILEGGKFTLLEDAKINMKFRGTVGVVSEICIKDLADSSFVETDGNVVTLEGSYIEATLSRLRSIRWRGSIRDLPKHADLTQECPYGIIATKNQRLTQAMVNIDLETEYTYSYDVPSRILRISREETPIRNIEVDLREEDGSKLRIFMNMTAVIYALVLTDEDGNDLDVLLQRTFRKYVPITINSPILVTDEADRPFELSASYREVVKPEWTIDLFSKERPMEMKKRLLTTQASLAVYGIPADAAIRLNESEIEMFASKYVLLPEEKYTVDGDRGLLQVDARERAAFKYIAVRYQHAERFSYLFTLYEREIFDAGEAIQLTHAAADVVGGVRIYGLHPETARRPECLYRIPKASMINAIDLYASRYDLLGESEYRFGASRTELEIASDARYRYDQFVVDYLKDDCFCINELPEYGQYEVEICSAREKLYLSYEMNDDGGVAEYSVTEIRPDKDKYIVLRKEASDRENLSVLS